jgi:hypothetical protein
MLDVAVRMGSLILLINEVEYVNRNFNEYVVILNLNGYDTVLEKIKERQQKTDSGEFFGFIYFRGLVLNMGRFWSRVLTWDCLQSKNIT